MTTDTERQTGTESTREVRTVLVTGASGRTGRRVAEAAAAQGAAVRAASRSSEWRFDWDDPATWTAALDGADAAYLAHPADIGAPGAAEQVGAVAARAVELGVRRLVLLSARGEDQAVPTEEALKASGAEWTVVRSAWFAQNLSEGPIAESAAGGELVFPAGEVLEPFVDLRDLGEVVAAALVRPEPAGRVLDVTGPRLLSWREAAEEITAGTGRKLTYVPVSVEEYGGILRGAGLPAEEVAFLEELFRTLLDGRNAAVSHDVRDVLGRPPRDFADFVRDAFAG
ncbi:NAD(P)H-binding protein [Streptomyces sp. NPDC060194]|uniref:NmrA family NAD(P)-binding protein n=1 Tax=Streptomyces sp. NPDC060194 TaxID=3347069 RepID=UPI003664A124